MKKRQGRIAGLVTGVLVVLMAAGTLFGQGTEERKADEGLAALMQQNRQHFQNLVQTAFFEGVQRPLEAADYQQIRQEAGAIAEIAQQARENHSRGEEFNELAGDLEEHAMKAAEAADGRKLPDINVEIGEMAEYCAECHASFRWRQQQ